MARPRTTRCKVCGRPTSEVGPLSARKRCQACGEAAVWRVAVQLAERSGPEFERWRRATILALLNLDTGPGASLDLISDETLAELLSTGATEALR